MQLWKMVFQYFSVYLTREKMQPWIFFKLSTSIKPKNGDSPSVHTEAVLKGDVAQINQKKKKVFKFTCFISPILLGLLILAERKQLKEKVHVWDLNI